MEAFQGVSKTSLKIDSLNPTKTLKIGLIGCGSKGSDHLKALTSLKNLELLAISDNSESTLSAIQNLGQFKLFKNYKEMVNTVNLDAVVISVPHNLHLPIALESLDNGLHILIEKPLSLNLQEAKLINSKSKERNKKVMVGTQRRFEGSFALGKNLLSEIGRLFSFRYNYTINCDLDTLGWRGIKNIAGGGALMDMGYHALDILTWYCGLPEEVYLHGGKIAKPNANSEVEDTALLTFSYESNLSGYIFLSRAISPEEEELKLNGEQGSLHVKRGQIKLFKKGLTEPVIELKETKSKSEIYIEQINHFYDAVTNGKELISDISYNINNMALIEAAYISLESKKPINPKSLI